MAMPEDENQAKPKQRMRRSTSSKSVSTSSSSRSKSSYASASKPIKAPDGGYGYVIVFCAFMTMLITDGVASAFGVLYADLLNVFQESKSLTSWILSIYNGSSCLFGPLSSALATKYGCRKMQIIGGIIASFGIFLSAFSNSVGMMCLTYGVLGGFGMSMGYVTSVVMVAQYFEKKRALAMGISLCGSGIGTFIFAPLFEHLLHTYGWHGTLIITSAITLNLIVLGALLRPLERTPKEEWLMNFENFEKMSRNISDAGLSAHDILDEKGNVENDRVEQMNYSVPQLPLFMEGKAEVPNVELSELRPENKNAGHVSEGNFQRLSSKRDATLTDGASWDSDNYRISNTGDAIDAFEQEIVYSGKCLEKNIRRFDKNANIDKIREQFQDNYSKPKKDISSGTVLSKFVINNVQSKSCPNLHLDETSYTRSDKECDHRSPSSQLMKILKQIKRILQLMFDPHILRNPLFILFLISNFILYFWYDLPYVFLFDYVIELGLSHERAAYVISIIGIVSTVGQVLYGVLGDRNIHLAILYSTSLILCGFSLLAVPLVDNYLMLCIISGSIGLFISANYCLTPVILVKFVGVEKLTNAYGLIMMVQGIASLLGPPVAGKLYDVSGSYYNTFFVGGMFISLSGLMVVAVKMIECVRDKLKTCRTVHRTPDLNKNDTVDTTVNLITASDIEIKV